MLAPDEQGQIHSQHHQYDGYSQGLNHGKHQAQYCSSEEPANSGRLFLLVEDYPDLKANQNMLALQEELTSTENKVAFSRQAYNDAVTRYNTAREVFPAVVFVGMLGFAEATLFEIEEPAEREAPKVSFD